MTNPAPSASGSTFAPEVTPVPRQAKVLVVSRGVSTLGSTLTSFGLDVWVYRETGSYHVFATLVLLTALPSLLFAPFAGYLSDRLNKRKMLLACDAISMLTVCIALVAYLSGHLTVPVVACVVFILAMSTEMRWSALGPLVTMVVAREHLGRMNGLQQSFRGVTVMLGPVLGAVGLDLIGLPLLLALDMLSYAVGIAGLLSVVVPPTVKSEASYVFRSFWDELTYGFRWVFERPPLRTLLLFFMSVNIGVSIFTASFTPYLLSRGSSSALGIALGLLGAGMFFTGMLLVRHRRRGGVGNHERRVIVGSLAYGMCMIAWGLCRSPIALCILAPALGASTSVIMASSQTIWQTHVPVQIQGKVFAVRTVLSFSLVPLSILLSLPLASLVFEPLLTGSAVVTAVWGADKASALGLMISSLGAGVACCAVGLLLRGGLRLDPAPPAAAPHVAA